MSDDDEANLILVLVRKTDFIFIIFIDLTRKPITKKCCHYLFDKYL